MKTLFALLLIAALGALAWRLAPLPGKPQPYVQAPQAFAYGIGLIEDIDRERGLVTIKHGPLSALHAAPASVSYFTQDKGQLAGLRPMTRVEFQVLHDGNVYLLTDIRLRNEESDQAGVLPVCLSTFRHSGRAIFSQTASARSAAPPSAT